MRKIRITLSKLCTVQSYSYINEKCSSDGSLFISEDVS